MPVITEAGNFTPATGNVTVNLSNFGGEIPKLVFLETSLGSGVAASNGGISIGFIDSYGNQGTIGTSTQHAVTSSNTRRVIFNNKCLAAYRLKTSPGTLGPVGDMSIAADKFSGVFSGADYDKVGYLAIGDDGSGDVDAEIIFGTAPSSNGSQTYYFDNIEPNVLFMMTAGLSTFTSGSHGNFGFGFCVNEDGTYTQNAMGLGSLTASADSQTRRLNSPNHIVCYPFNGVILEEASVTSMATSGVTLNWSVTNATGRTFVLVGLKVPEAKIVKFNTNGSSSQSVSVGINAKAGFFQSLISGSPGSGVQSGARTSLGVTDGTNVFNCGYTDQDSVPDTICSRWTYTDKVIQASTDAASSTLQGTVSNLDSTTTLAYSPTDADGDEIVGLFVGDALTSFSASGVGNLTLSNFTPLFYQIMTSCQR